MRSRTRGWLWRWRRNPLRRRVDRMEGWAGVCAVTAALVAGPAAGVAASGTVTDALTRPPEGRRATAVLREDAGYGDTLTTEARGTTVRATVRWTHDGEARTGEAPVPPGSQKHARVEVWLDGEGVPREPPPDTAQVATVSTASGGLAGAGAAALVAVGHRRVRRGLEERRAEEWAREWEEVGPRWCRRP